MKKVTLTREARADLKNFAHFTWPRWGREQGIKYLAILDEGFQRLAEKQLLGRDFSESTAAIASFPSVAT